MTDPGAELAALRAAVDDFLLAVVHDIRGPLSQVRTFTALLGRQHQGALNADGRELCGLIETASKRAVDVLDSIHAYTQVLDAPVFELADLNAAVDTARYAQQSAIEENLAIVTRDDLPSIRGDQKKLLLLFEELLRNALKFRSESPPRIHCSAQRHDRSILISVADNGVGVPGNKSELVFKPLKRLHGRGHEGTGMGLAICQRIVEMHGGRIWVEARPEGGADFRFTLPATNQD